MTIDESWNEKLARIGSALGFFVTSSVRNLASQLMDGYEQDGEEEVNREANDGKDVNGVNGKR